jgi:membrane fusion protein, multidrug efflux system
MNTRRWLGWGVAALVVAGIAASVGNALLARKTQQQAATASLKTETVVELAATDVVQAQPRELAQGLPVSGSLKAINSAVVKARTAGELQGLTVREGDTVRAGQVIARVDATEYQSRVRQAQQQADAAKAQIDIAQRQFDNNKALVDQGFISRTALDTSMANLSAAQANHNAALAAVDVARKAVDDTVLRAPIGGTVSARLAQPGERVGVEARIVEIVDLSRLELEAALGASDSLRVRVGQVARLQIEGSSASTSASAPVTARVVRINPTAQAGSRSVLVYLALDAAASAGLRQGLFAQGTLGTERVTALAVPLSAVRTDKPVPYVQVVEQQKIAHRTVETGSRGDAAGETWVAVKGVAEGATVTRVSAGALREGTAVRFTQPAAAAGVGNGRITP